LPQVSIRLATINDATLLSGLAVRTFSETFGSHNTPENMASYLANSFSPTKQAEELADPNGWVKIAEIDAEAVGYAMMHAGLAPAVVNGERPIELVRLYVSQKSIGSGVGAALMKDCLDESATRGYQTIWLGVWEHNHRALAFYRRWKFVEVGTHIFQLGDDPQTDLVMMRSL
jgi:diamine N-acetyltransferase